MSAKLEIMPRKPSVIGLMVFSLLLGYAIMSIAYSQVAPPEEDVSWPVENHLTVAQHAEMLDVMNKLPGHARQHVMITDSEGTGIGGKITKSINMGN